MAQCIYRYDYTGTLQEGVFFELAIPMDLEGEYPPHERRKGTIVNELAWKNEEPSLVYGTMPGLSESYVKAKRRLLENDRAGKRTA